MLMRKLITQLEVAELVRNLVKGALNIAIQLPHTWCKDVEELLEKRHICFTLFNHSESYTCRAFNVFLEAEFYALIFEAGSWGRNTTLSQQIRVWGKQAMGSYISLPWIVLGNKHTSRMGLAIAMLQTGIYSTSATTPINCLDPPRLLAWATESKKSPAANFSPSKRIPLRKFAAGWIPIFSSKPPFPARFVLVVTTCESSASLLMA